MKKVLIITYYWPPAGGPGVQRWLKYSKYLQRKGVQVDVLTVSPESAIYPQRDASLEKEIEPGVRVFRSADSSPLNWIQKFFPKKDIPFSGFANQKKVTFADKILRFVRGNLFLPDARKSWNTTAIPLSMRLMHENVYSSIISTGPPHSSHLIAEGLKKKYPKVFWIVDYRDPWTDIYYNDLLYQTPLAKRFDRAIEKRILQKANHIMTASFGFKKVICDRWPQLSAKTTPITNGYDAEDMLPSLPKKKGKWVYGGTLSSVYPLQKLLDYLLQLPAEVKSDIQLHFIGSVDEDSKQKLEKLHDFELVFKGYTPHHQLMREYQDAEVGILLVPEGTASAKGIIPAKIFEYLGMQLFVLAFGAAGSDVQEIVNNSKQGVYNPVEWVAFEKNQDNNEIYSRDFLAKRILEILP